jgi:acyl-CoA reductase-like NAD-dependent aldehyde dehydrogenase
LTLSSLSEAEPGSAGDGKLPAGGSELSSALQWARLAQPEWAGRTLEQRSGALERACQAMLRDRATVLRLAKAEMGKHEAEGIFTEALGPLDTLSAWKRVIAEAWSRDVPLNRLSFPAKQARVDLVPRGVVGVTAPWNYPVAGLYRSVFPALLTGNAVVVKPSEYTPRTSAWLIEHLAREVPHGIVQVVQGGPSVGAALVESGIDACVFTGSISSGAKVRIRCAELGIPASVEMGGKDAAIVLADCDLERTVAGLTQWALSNSGQACGAIEVAYVQAEIADELVERLQRAWSRLRTGPGAEDVEIHPIAHQAQLEVIEAHVADALAKGARLLCGGQRTGNGLGFPPTLLDRCTDAMSVVRDETFGPVLAVVSVSGAAEAVERVNASRYGLGASIWTRDTARAERLSERLDVGVVTINNHAFTGAIPALPWSGTRATGYGVANSTWSLLTFCRPKTITTDRGRRPDPYWMPFDRDLKQLGELLADVQLRRWREAWKLPLLLRRRIRRIRAFFEAR